MRVPFTKVVGTGNDFIILDNRAGSLRSVIDDVSRFTVNVCKRKICVGADGVLLLEDSDRADLKMRVFNPDGSEVTMCGNGARCSAFYAAHNGVGSGELSMETGAGIIRAEVRDDMVKLKMTDPKQISLDKDLGIERSVIKTHSIDTGVPHVIHFTENIETYPVKEMGAKIRYHHAFQPDGTNVNFVKIVSDGVIRIRTYERGVEDETLACGTGSVAAAIAACLVYGTAQPVEVLTASGESLKVYFNAKNKKNISDVFLEGTAKIIYEGGIDYV